MVIGFTVFAGLLAYAITLICLDTVQRKQKYQQQLQDDYKKLDELGFTKTEIEELKKIFQRMEEIGKEAFEQEQAESVAAVN